MHARLPCLNDRITKLEKTVLKLRDRIKRLESRLGPLEAVVANLYNDDEESTMDEQLEDLDSTLSAVAEAERTRQRRASAKL